MMPKRYIFRLTYGANIDAYLNDGEIRSKNHTTGQLGYRTSYGDIVERRGGADFNTPCGHVVNDFVPFYFSPITSMAYTIHLQNVDLVDPSGNEIGKASMEDIVFIVADPNKIAAASTMFWFSNIACNSMAQNPLYENDIEKLGTHVDWNLFDDQPMIAKINEIGYGGVCRWFHDNERKLAWSNRSKKRMAEFLVKDSFSMDFVECFVIKSTKWEHFLTDRVSASGRNIPIIVNPGCYF